MLFGCASPSYLKTKLLNDVQENGYTSAVVEKQGLPIFYVTNFKNSKTARLYIEGDGTAFVSRTQVSDNPTPIEAVAYELMKQDQSNQALYYLARPCQFCWDANCTPKLWTSERFSKRVLTAYNELLDSLKDRHTSFELIGYSGGAALALLLAATRDDILRVITFAGLTDVSYWCKIKGFTPLDNSLNPADFTEKLEKIPQVHFAGKKDKNVPLEVLERYLCNFKDSSPIHKIVKEDFDHFSNWGLLWVRYHHKG
ncbi:MAG TPA: alpha/beta hydrolase [Alphaproteobacteria bacterium]|nr:alpha/beta hydrolase [Alphaproteobacteria bacterium]